MNSNTLEEIVNVLQDDARNYTVFLASFEMPLMYSSTSAALIERALGEEAVLGGIEEVQHASAWLLVEEALLYVGDCGAGPSAVVITSKKLAVLIDALKEQVAELVKTTTKIESFWLKAGHPAYPVFWDFALLFRTDTSATLFIGSSSD